MRSLLHLHALSLPFALALTVGCSSGSDSTDTTQPAETGGSAGASEGGSGGSSQTGGAGGAGQAGTGGGAAGTQATGGAAGSKATGGSAGTTSNGGHAGTAATGGSAGTSTTGGSAGTSTTGGQAGSTSAGGAGGGAGQAGATQTTGGAAGEGGASGAGGEAGGQGGAGQSGGAGFVAPMTQVVDLGGPVMKTPKIQLIAYTEDTMVPDVEAFITEFGATNEWATQTAEYGVGAFTQLPTILILGTPPTALDDNSGNVTPFEKTLVANITGASPVWTPEDGNVMYVFVLPSGTDIDSGGHCCSDFLGYHYEAPLPSGGAPYAVVCNCAPQPGDPLTTLDYLTTTVSHEMVESATDPFTSSNPAFAQSDDADAIWTVATGGEVADMCQYNTDANYTPPGSKYMIQRSWSNAAALAGKDPCLPLASTEPYFNAYPTLTDPITLNYYGPWSTDGVSIAVGQTKVIDVVLHSAAPTSGPWTVTAWDLDDFLGTGSPNTTVSLDKTTGVDGDVLHLTIHVLSYDSSFGGAGFVLESTLNGQDNLIYAAVGQ